ncbi:flagellar hook capping FlgD N-terminal domain-containing protein [Poriferisphaera sp. WC338]|uniref:flagellar hook capping FlgD N-terminal domain-containing protein n=1 Tax=Poriferisphaera sp. WC338 TaxID=3425129 RepID=UPI003D819345
MSSAIGGTAANGLANGASSTNKFAEMSSAEFVKLMVAELSNQDPFEPNDSAAVLEQLSSLRNIESQSSLQSSLEAMVNQQTISQAGGLIGYQVTGLDAQNDSTTGIVTSVRIVNGKAQLQLNNNKTLEMDRLTDIQVPQQEPDETPLLWDANGDNQVNAADADVWYDRWAEHNGKEPGVDSEGRIQTWKFSEGDFNTDGKVDIQDLAIMQNLFANLASQPST